MGFCYQRMASGRHALCCDICGHAGGCRKVKCPHGWCQAVAMCADCRKGKKLPANYHEGCAESSHKFKERMAREKAMMDAGIPVRVAALGKDGGKVHVIFRSKNGEVGFLMDDAVYRAVSVECSTPDDYRKFGRLEEAGAKF